MWCGSARNGQLPFINLGRRNQNFIGLWPFSGEDAEDYERNLNWHFDPREIDVLILSHAHIDHTGRVPKLVKDGFNGKIYSTHATRSLCAIMLLDSAMIQEKDAEYYNARQIKKHKNSKTKIKLRTPCIPNVTSLLS